MSENGTGFKIYSAAFLHVYPQHSWHSPATIRGNVEALKALRDALDEAISEGKSAARAFATDGEGYEILVERCATMAHIGEPFYAMQEIAQGVLREGQYEARFKLRETVQLTRKAFDELWAKAGLPPDRNPWQAPSPAASKTTATKAGGQ